MSQSGASAAALNRGLEAVRKEAGLLPEHRMLIDTGYCPRIEGERDRCNLKENLYAASFSSKSNPNYDPKQIVYPCPCMTIQYPLFFQVLQIPTSFTKRYTSTRGDFMLEEIYLLLQRFWKGHFLPIEKEELLSVVGNSPKVFRWQRIIPLKSLVPIPLAKEDIAQALDEKTREEFASYMTGEEIRFPNTFHVLRPISAQLQPTAFGYFDTVLDDMEEWWFEQTAE